ncbi:hypothetical protein [Coleofasciculus sp. FACHB-1120]|uniref:hypothetical protein n=1 Tax=Coleofasciculus sp. FACHB-1120 TaxID=2692783 RepID=UPI0016874F45|nr:hypothetical protein [Coleofasciculus sp. FACHB-1120]MBD2742100.1 hypothetical protein [Coleofasciculus sp. FACHB-1120]
MPCLAPFRDMLNWGDGANCTENLHLCSNVLAVNRIQLECDRSLTRFFQSKCDRD